MDMTYKWHLPQPTENIHVGIDCLQERKVFTASMQLKKYSLSTQNLKQFQWRIVLMTFMTVFGIYGKHSNYLLNGCRFMAIRGPTKHD